MKMREYVCVMAYKDKKTIKKERDKGRDGRLRWERIKLKGGAFIVRGPCHIFKLSPNHFSHASLSSSSEHETSTESKRMQIAGSDFNG